MDLLTADPRNLRDLDRGDASVVSVADRRVTVRDPVVHVSSLHGQGVASFADEVKGIVFHAAILCNPKATRQSHPQPEAPPPAWGFFYARKVTPRMTDIDEHETGPDEPVGPHQGETEDDHHSPDEEDTDVAD